MHPLRIEPITNRFPDLNIIIAHLGVHWNHDAAELVRMRDNVYVDLTGEPGGWRQRITIDTMNSWFWWEGAFEKIVFGTDVHYSKIKQILDQDIDLYTQLKLDMKTNELIFSKNILRLLGM